MRRESFRLVTIDGIDGAGKSPTASWLAGALGFQWIELDKFLNEGKPGYVDYIRYADLRQRIFDARSQSTPVIVEGVCVLEVLDRIEEKPDLTIYIKRPSADGFWRDFEYFDFSVGKGAEEIIAELKTRSQRLAEFLSGADTTGQNSHATLLHEIIRYHYRYRPHETADYVFESTV